MVAFHSLVVFFQVSCNSKIYWFNSTLCIFYFSYFFRRYVAREYLQRKNRNKLENTLIIVGDVDSIYKLLENIGENFLVIIYFQVNRVNWADLYWEKIQPISELSKYF